MGTRFGHALGISGVLLSIVFMGWRPDAPRESAVGGPRLVPLDSTLLDETRDYVGDVWSFAVRPSDGSFLIADLFSRRVLRFTRSGDLLGTYGRAGRGPGEFAGLTQVFLLNDSVFAAHDHQRSLIHRYHVDGTHLSTLHHLGLLGGQVVDGGIVWLGTVDPTRTFSIARWDLGSDELTYLGPVPREYQESEDYWAHCTTNYLAVWGDTLLVGFCGRNELFVTDLAGEVRDTIHVPLARRRGVPDDIVNRMERENSIERRVEMLSLLQNLYRLPDGSLALVHFDSRLSGVPPGGRLSARGWLSILSPSLDRACVDAPLPAEPDVQPRTSFRGDTVFVFDRRLEGEQMETWIKAYRISTDGCRWLDIVK